MKLTEKTSEQSTNRTQMSIEGGQSTSQGHSRRIQGGHVDVSYEDISSFFEERGQNQELKHRYNYVLFQDSTPELAVQRDAQEKKKIGELLNFRKNDRALDIGCGVGRWGEKLCEEGIYYVGIDGSASLIRRAKENLSVFPSKKLLVGYFQDLLDVLNGADESKPFDLILVNGVFMYLNDSDFEKALYDIKRVCAPSCQIYIKESMGITDRLTLDGIYSEGLKQKYSAIYRSIDEYREATQRAFGDEFRLVSEGMLFDDVLRNRKETLDYYLVWKR